MQFIVLVYAYGPVTITDAVIHILVAVIKCNFSVYNKNKNVYSVSMLYLTQFEQAIECVLKNGLGHNKMCIRDRTCEKWPVFFS